MRDIEFGLIMTLAGMGVTFITLYILTLVIHLLDRLYPYKEKKKDETK